MYFINYLNKTKAKVIHLLLSSIKYRLFIILLTVITTPILFFSLLTYNLSSKAVENDYKQYKKSLNSQIIKNIDENIHSIIKQSNAIYLNLDTISYFLNNPLNNMDSKYFETRDTMNNYFLTLLQSNDSIYGISLLSLDGNMKFSLNKGGNSVNSYSVKDELWFKNAIALKGTPMFRDPHFDEFAPVNSTDGRKLIISISRAICDQYDNSKIYGVLSVDEEINQFWKIVSNTETDSQEIIILMGKSGDLIYTNQKLNTDILTQLSSITSSQNLGSFNIKINGIPMFVNYGKSSEFGLKVISLLPSAQLQKKSTFLKNINIFLLAVMIIFSFALSTVFSAIIVGPLKKLAYSFEKLQNGDFNTNIIVKGSDEFAQISLTFNTMVINIKTLISEKYEIGILKKQAELETLQSQINPHFLFNTLTSIKAVIDDRDIDKSSIMVQNLSDLFRYSLNRGKYEVSFSEELSHIKKYLYIQECRFKDKYQVLYDIDDEVFDYGILRLTLQPIVENAFYHGLDLNRGKGELTITAKALDDTYNIYITDNGLGIPRDELDKMNELLIMNPETLKKLSPEKIGIYNVNSRIKFHYGNSFGIKIYSVQGAETTIKITLPIRNHKQTNTVFKEGK